MEFHDTIVYPGFSAIFCNCKIHFVYTPFFSWLTVVQPATFIFITSGKKIIPYQFSIIKSLSVIPVFYINQYIIALTSLIKCKIILITNANLWKCITSVYQIPVLQIIPDSLVISFLGVWWNLVEFQPLLPDIKRSGLIDYPMSVIKQQF